MGNAVTGGRWGCSSQQTLPGSAEGIDTQQGRRAKDLLEERRTLEVMSLGSTVASLWEGWGVAAAWGFVCFRAHPWVADVGCSFVGYT